MEALAALLNYAGMRIDDGGEFDKLALALMDASDINRHKLETATSTLEARSLPSTGKH